MDLEFEISKDLHDVLEVVSPLTARGLKYYSNASNSLKMDILFENSESFLELYADLVSSEPSYDFSAVSITSSMVAPYFSGWQKSCVVRTLDVHFKRSLRRQTKLTTALIKSIPIFLLETKRSNPTDLPFNLRNGSIWHYVNLPSSNDYSHF